MTFAVIALCSNCLYIRILNMQLCSWGLWEANNKIVFDMTKV